MAWCMQKSSLCFIRRLCEMMVKSPADHWSCSPAPIYTLKPLWRGLSASVRTFVFSAWEFLTSLCRARLNLLDLLQSGNCFPSCTCCIKRSWVMFGFSLQVNGFVKLQSSHDSDRDKPLPYSIRGLFSFAFSWGSSWLGCLSELQKQEAEKHRGINYVILFTCEEKGGDPITYVC